MLMNCTTQLANETLSSRVIKALFMAIIFVAAVVLNVKTFLVLLKRKRHHRNVVTIFLLNLTLVSALMMSQVPFNIHAIIEQAWIFGNGFCQFNGFSNVFLCMNLIFTLLCLTIDRYLAVVKPLRHRTIMTRRTAYHMLVAVYVLSFLLAVVPILGKARYKYHPGTNHCSPAWANSCGYAAAMTTIAFILPILGMLITYTRIFLTLRHKRVLMSKSSTSTMSSKDMQDVDSNSLRNFEDTSTDPSGDCGVRLAAHKTMVHSKDGVLEYGLEIGASLENLVDEDSTIHQTAGEMTACKITGESEEHLAKVAVNVRSSCGHLEEKRLTKEHARDKPTGFKISGNSKENVVGNGLDIGSPSKQLHCGLETWSSNEHLTSEHSTANDMKEKGNTGLGDNSGTAVRENKGVSIVDDANKARITHVDVIGTGEEFSRLQDPEKVNDDVEGRRILKLSVDDTTNKLRLRLAEKELVGRNMAGTDKPEMPRSESSVPNSNAGEVSAETCPAEKVTSDAATTSSDHESDVFDREETHMADNKQVSFQNSIKVNPSKSKDKEAKRRLSNIFPVSRKAIHGLVSRMKRQRAIRHEYKIARTGTILVVTFLILWMPYIIAHLCFAGNCRTMTFYNIATFLVYTNALANPIIYALTNRAVMQDIRNSMGRLCQSR